MSREFDLYELAELVRSSRFPNLVLPEETSITFSNESSRSIMDCIYWQTPFEVENPTTEHYVLKARPVLRPRNLRNFRVLVGGIAHELCHLICYRRGMIAPHDEKYIDRMVIELGMGLYLMETKAYIHEWDPEVVFRGYTAEEIAGQIGSQA